MRTGRLGNRVAVVTGGASGIGAETCRRLSQEGARIAILDLDRTRAETVAQELPDAFAVACDVSDSASVEAAFSEIVRKAGRIDILVNNAGALGNEEYAETGRRVALRIEETKTFGEPRTHLESTLHLTDQQWRRMIATHLDGTFFCSRAVLPVMAAAGAGAIVNMSSIAGLTGAVGNPHYSAAKAGILGFTRALAKEVVGQGIRVNAVAPGFIDTPLRDAIPEAIRAQQLQATPIGRIATASEVAAAIAFLASDDSSYIVGETITIAGGVVTI